MEERINDLLSDSLQLTQAGKADAGLKQALRAYALARAGQDDLQQAQALLAQAEAYFRLGQYPQAIDLSQTALNLVSEKEASADPDEKINALRVLAHASYRLGCCAGETDSLGSPEPYFHRAIELCRAVGEKRLLARCLHSLAAGIYMPRGQFALALATDEETLQLLEESHQTDLLWGPYGTMSWVYLLSGEDERSAAYLERLREVAQPETLAAGWQALITAHLDVNQGRLDEGEMGFKAVGSLAERIGSPELTGFAQLGRARICRLRGEGVQARQWAEDTYALEQRLGYQHVQAMAQIEIGRCWLEVQDYPQAEAAFQLALVAAQPVQAWLEICISDLNLAYIAQTTGSQPAADRIAHSLTEIQAHGFFFLVDQERAAASTVLVAALTHPDAPLVKLAETLLEGLQRTPPPPLRVATLGGLKVYVGARQVDPKALRKRRAGELLVLLLISPAGRLCLEDAAEQLWPEHPAATALDLLRQASSALRHALEPELPPRFPSRYLLVEEGVMRLNLGAAVDRAAVDFNAFEALCRQGDWQAARRVYTGDFLPEFRFAEWILPHSEHLLLLYQQCLLECARLEYAAGDFPAALATCRQLLKLEPWQEQAVLLGMRAARQLGDMASARRLYLSLEQTLHSDLGAAPGPELRAFYRSLSSPDAG